MLRLRAIEVRGYRAFAGWTRLELRPLTLLYGRNNAGKSSLLRLLAVLADSVEDGARSALELHGEAGRGGRFKDLPWMGDGVPRSAFRLRLCWELDGASAFTDELELAWSDERSRAVVRAFSIRNADDNRMLRGLALPFPDDTRYMTSSIDEDPDEPVNVTVISWAGLQPTSWHGDAFAKTVLTALRDRLASLKRSVTWLDSNRPRPDKLVPAQDAVPTSLKHDGSNSLEFLTADPGILNEVHAWFARSPIERDLRLKPAGEGYVSPMLGSTRSTAEFHILDAGEGMAHVLPVLVGMSLVNRGSGYRVLAVEEPESHLHGDAQHSLAHRLAEIAAGDDPPIMILETHSRLLLLGVQLAVAKGLMPPERGQVLWCEQGPSGASTLTQIEITHEGGLRGWPRPALADEAEMIRELLDRQEAFMGEVD